MAVVEALPAGNLERVMLDLLERLSWATEMWQVAAAAAQGAEDLARLIG